MTPLVICAGIGALSTAAKASHYYAAAGIVPHVIRPSAGNIWDGNFALGVKFIDDEGVEGISQVRRFLEANGKEMAQFGRKPGWYLQQYLKLAAAAQVGAPLVFIADGDTVFSADLLRRILLEPTVLTTKEAHPNYTALLARLDIMPAVRSCVANGNFFSDHPLLRQLGSPSGFISAMRHVVASMGAMDFSEYQFAGALLEPQIGSMPLKMFRRFDLLTSERDPYVLRRIKNGLKKYDAVALEFGHGRSTAKRVAAHCLYSLSRSW